MPKVIFGVEEDYLVKHFAPLVKKMEAEGGNYFNLVSIVATKL